MPFKAETPIAGITSSPVPSYGGDDSIWSDLPDTVFWNGEKDKCFPLGPPQYHLPRSRRLMSQRCRPPTSL